MTIRAATLAITLLLLAASVPASPAHAQSPCSLPTTEIIVGHSAGADPSPATETRTRTAVRTALSNTLRALCQGTAFDIIAAAGPRKLLYTGAVNTNAISAALLALDVKSTGPSDLAAALRFLQRRRAHPNAFDLVLIVDDATTRDAAFNEVLDQARTAGAEHILVETVGPRQSDAPPNLPAYAALVRRPDDVRAWVAGQRPAPPAPHVTQQVQWKRPTILVALVFIVLILSGVGPAKKQYQALMQKRAMTETPLYKPEDGPDARASVRKSARHPLSLYSVTLLPEGRRLHITEDFTQIGCNPLAEVYVEDAPTTLCFCHSRTGLEITNTGDQNIFIGSMPLTPNATVVIPSDVTAECRLTTNLLLRMSCEEVVYA
jgi:hypothetical protein